MVEVIPVLDIRGGIAVSGKSGNRESYKALRSVFSNGHDPGEIARALPYERLYIADLDGIVEEKPDFDTIKALSKQKKVMIDIGVRDADDLDVFNELECDIILGTETINNPKTISKALKLFDNRVIVSIDIKNEVVTSGFLPGKPQEAYYVLRDMGVSRFIFLNISAVGTQKADFSFIKDLNMSDEILIGGGITSKDLEKLEKLKVSGVLIGTAIHNGLWK